MDFLPEAYYNRNTPERVFFAINLSFFAEGEKTEAPTHRKREKARDEGQVAKSTEIGTAFLFIMIFFSLKMIVPGMMTSINRIFYFNFSSLENATENFNLGYVTSYGSNLVFQLMLLLAPIFAVSMIAGLISNFMQVGWHPTSKALMPKLNRISPMSGLKRLFSFQKLLDAIKSIIKLLIIGFCVYSMLTKEMDKLPLLIDMSIYEAFAYVGEMAVDLGINVGVIYLFIALLDYMYQRYEHTKKLKMTKQEVKEEYKMTEGNPQIKSRIRQKMREASMRRMMQTLPTADVIITNPTHYAVALKYDIETMKTPVVVAKGVDFIAKRIKDAARQNNIQIVEDVQLARALYNMAEVGKEIPPELYAAVAQVLVFVFELKGKNTPYGSYVPIRQN